MNILRVCETKKNKLNSRSKNKKFHFKGNKVAVGVVNDVILIKVLRFFFFSLCKSHYDFINQHSKQKNHHLKNQFHCTALSL